MDASGARRRTEEEIEEAWTLGPEEHALVAGKKAGPTRLGFALLLKFFAKAGRFPGAGEIDAEAVSLVARHVGVATEEYADYDRTGRTAEHHRAQIRETFGFRSATVGDSDALAAWLLEGVAPYEYDAKHLKEAAFTRLRGDLAVKGSHMPVPHSVEKLAASVRMWHPFRP